MSNIINASLQHHILSLLFFNKEHAKTIRQSIEVKEYIVDAGLTTLIKGAYAYIDNYGMPPEKEIYIILDQSNIPADQKPIIRNLLDLLDAKTGSIPAAFVMDNVLKFHKQSTYRKVVETCYPLLDRPDQFDKIDALFQEAVSKRHISFQAGTTLRDAVQRRLTTDKIDRDCDVIHTGIGPLDDHRIMPSRGKMFLFISLQKSGKTWFMVKMGKQALLENKKVAHITLELDEEQTSDRYIQAFGGLATDVHEAQKQRAFLDSARNTLQLNYPFDVKMMDDHAELSRLSKLFETSPYSDNLRIKEFPMKSLSVDGLEAYLDGLINYEDFAPDVLLVDYPDIMKLQQSENKRTSVGETYELLRGLAQRRKLILVCVSQVNRSAKDKDVTRIDTHMIGEDWSKISTADIIVSFHRTDFEKEMGLGRLYVAASRHTVDGIEILLGQNYATGQFAITAAAMTKNLLNDVKNLEQSQIQQQQP